MWGSQNSKKYKILNTIFRSGGSLELTTVCPQKKLHLLCKTIGPLKIVLGIKVRSDSESAGAELSVEYHNFPVAQQGAKIFEFKVDPVPKLTFLNVMSGV